MLIISSLRLEIGECTEDKWQRQFRQGFMLTAIQVCNDIVQLPISMCTTQGGEISLGTNKHFGEPDACHYTSM